MADDPVAATEAAPESEDGGAVMDRAVAAVKARQEAAEPAAATPVPAAEKPPRRSGDIAALAKREWELTQRSKAVDQAAAKFQPLQDALGKKDLTTVLTLLAQDHGVEFNQFVDILSAEKPPEKTPAEIARETVSTELAKAREADAKARAEAESKDIDTRVGKMRERLQGIADTGGERWELTSVSERAGEAWDLIEKWNAETGQAMPLETALDHIETKLKQKREARRPKQESAANPSQGGKPGNEADAGRKNGRAAEPSFSNRNTSGAATAVGKSDDDDDAPVHEAIARAAKRANIRL